jgi:hypothetical protein
MSPFWPEGYPLELEADEWWTPLCFVWSGENHSVEGIIERWRIDEAWWRGRIWREYFRLTTRSGLLVEVYHDLTTGDWFIQRLYD